MLLRTLLRAANPHSMDVRSGVNVFPRASSSIKCWLAQSLTAAHTCDKSDADLASGHKKEKVLVVRPFPVLI